MPDRCPICQCEQVQILTPNRRRCTQDPDHEWIRLDDSGNAVVSPHGVSFVHAIHGAVRER